ncbi:cell division protein SepF [Planosporangium sp. 12N6]|uniref:cell division protein SepF n=1 Tax=Planosporangium spinosum TaxID=3402278 RepID=UPI003CF9E098
MNPDAIYDDDPVGYDDRWARRRPATELRAAGRRRTIHLDQYAGVEQQHQGHRQAGTDNDRFEIATIHAHSFRDARIIGEYYRQDIPVVIDLSALDDSDARRIVDFAAGLIFGRRGDIHRLTRGVFLLAPAGVTILTGGRPQVAGGDFFDQS